VTALFAALRPPGVFYPLFLGLVALWLIVRWGTRRRVGSARWDGFFRALERTALAVMILSMLLMAMLQIALRNLFHSGLIWIDPLERHLVLWIGVTGAVVAAGALRHMHMDVIGQVLPPRARLAVARLTTLVAAGICAVLAHAAWLYLGEEAQFGSTGLLGIRTWVLTCVLFPGFALMAARFAARALAPRATLEGLLSQREAGIAAEVRPDA
jgi:C4-dicarboxylate transporter, DctQ subunit